MQRGCALRSGGHSVRTRLRGHPSEPADVQNTEAGRSRGSGGTERHCAGTVPQQLPVTPPHLRQKLSLQCRQPGWRSQHGSMSAPHSMNSDVQSFQRRWRSRHCDADANKRRTSIEQRHAERESTGKICSRFWSTALSRCSCVVDRRAQCR